MKTKNLVVSGVLSVLMLGSFFGAQALTPSKYLADILPPLDLETAIPKSFGSWREEENRQVMVVDPVSAQVISEIYSQTLTRTYVDKDGRRVMLSIAYGKSQSDQRSLHYPDICYPAQGFNVMSTNFDKLKYDDGEIPVKRLSTRMGSRSEPLTYWVAIGSTLTLTTGQAKLAQLRYGFKGIIPDGMIYRVSTIGGEDGWRTQDEFSTELLRSLPSGIRERVAGLASERKASRL